MALHRKESNLYSAFRDGHGQNDLRHGRDHAWMVYASVSIRPYSEREIKSYDDKAALKVPAFRRL